jgi:hypothetical protein
MIEDKVFSLQLIEGSSDQVIFEHFLYRTLAALRRDSSMSSKDVCILLDNSSTHKHPYLQTLAEKFQVNFLFSAPYSPYL